MVLRPLISLTKTLLPKRWTLKKRLLSTSALSGLLVAQGATLKAFAQETPIDGLSTLIPDQTFANNGVMVVIFVGAFAFAMWSATWLIRERRLLDDSNRSLALELADLKARHERAQALLDVPDQRIVIWESRDQPPVTRGTLPENSGAPDDVTQFIAFGTWMTPQSAQSFNQAVERLRDHAESFDLTIETRMHSVIEVQGRASGSHAFVRFIGLSGDRAALAALEAQHTSLLQTTDTMKSLLENIPFPVWLRDTRNLLTWANTAYLNAVDAESFESMAETNPHLLDTSERKMVEHAHQENLQQQKVSHFRQRLPATISGDRRTMDVSEIAYEGGAAGLAVDMSEVEDVHAKLRRTMESNAQTMNQLATAVAIFDEHKHLTFRNDSFDSLWQLDAKFLDDEPDNGRLFDAMRENGKIAEQPDWSKWRNGLLSVYEETQPQEHWWHLPDGRTLRVVANPHKQGGVTWVFENITEQLEMESRYIELTQVQGETLDHLNEAIAVFAPNGQLKLSNPAFQKLWQLEDEQVAADTKISDLGKLCQKHMAKPAIWDKLSTGVTGVSDKRDSVSGRLSLKDKSLLDYALVPLPNGQSMLTFADVSAAVRLEHTLKERNEALQTAEQLKNDFIEHVSYEFRTPLTSIKGFAEALAQKVFGPLNKKQMEYVTDIETSSKVLHRLVDNLLDLATVDAGIMELDLSEIDLRSVMRQASDTVSSHLAEKNVKLQIKQKGGAARFVADEKRVMQVIQNLLSNAISHSPEQGTVLLESAVERDAVLLRVSDNGNGIEASAQKSIFERFAKTSKTEKRPGGGRGAGLGLSIARSLVELHGGAISVDSSPETGTVFTCRFPKLPANETHPVAEAAQ